MFPNKQLEIAARYSEILPDVAEQDQTEAGLAVNYYLRGHDLKVQADYRRLDFEDTLGDQETIDRDVFRVQIQVAF